MSLAEPLQRSQPLPEDVETPTAKLVYLAIDLAGETTVDELSDALDMKKLVLFETIGTLASKGLVERDGAFCTTQ